MNKALLAPAALAIVLAAGCGGRSTAAPQASAPTSARPGNGVDALDAGQIYTKSMAALRTATSYRMRITAAQDGQPVTMEFEVSGQNVKGTSAIGPATMTLIKVGDAEYLKGSEDYWSLTGATVAQARVIAERVGDRWVKIPISDQTLTALLGSADATKQLATGGSLWKGAVDDIGGVPAIGVIESSDNGGTLTDPKGTLYVATQGKPYPIELILADGSTTTLTDYDKKVTDIKPPPSADVVNLADLAKS